MQETERMCCQLIAYGDYCYYVHSQTDSTYEQARVACENEAATLTSVVDADEQAFLAQLHANVGGTFLWIGLNDITIENTFVWEDGNTFVFSAWASSNPDNSNNEDCVHLSAGSLWNDYSCGNSIGYICKRTKDWMLVFKAVAGIALPTETDALVYDPYQVWISSTAINADNPAAKLLDNSFSGHYKNLILDQHLGEIREIKMGLYNSVGVEVMHMVFNMTDVTDRDSWFVKNRLLSSPYDDIFTEGQNVFSVIGETVAVRRWYLSRNHNGCPDDTGWFAVITHISPSCTWELTAEQKPLFLYSIRNTYVNWNTYSDVGKADVFAIFVKMDYL
ncbi:uncharacterized protein [Amphiura filiformis]|uniref:uncharacterized protein isoform X2 n=1 Tax=Amphiura filiformis TaxID=82378 RepID=UPI003B21F0EC